MTVAIMTKLVLLGCTRRFLNDAHENVPMDTMIITATSAGMGICFTHGPKTTSNTSRKTPAVNVESRPRPPDFTLMTDCPIIAQPAMPPKRPETMFATP